jgi:hypothetical protein
MRLAEEVKLFAILITIIFCFSCTANNSTGHVTKNKMASLVSAAKSNDASYAAVEKEVKEVTCFIKKMSEEKGQVFIYADYIQRLDGEKAIEEAKRRGDADTAMIDGKMVIGVVNDYYIINDNPTIRKLPLDLAAKFEFVENPDRYGGKVQNTLQGLRLIYEDTPFVLTIKNGRVVKVFEIFVP